MPVYASEMGKNTEKSIGKDHFPCEPERVFPGSPHTPLQTSFRQ